MKKEDYTVFLDAVKEQLHAQIKTRLPAHMKDDYVWPR